MNGEQILNRVMEHLWGRWSALQDDLERWDVQDAYQIALNAWLLCTK